MSGSSSSIHGYPYLSPLNAGEEGNNSGVKRNLSSSPDSVINDSQMAYPIRKLSADVHPSNDVMNDEGDIIDDEEFLYPKEGASSTTATDGHHIEWGVLPPSSKCHRTMDPMRAVVEPLVANVRSGEERGDGKDPILLGLGDPTADLPPCPVALEAIHKAVESRNPPTGQVNPCGTLEARQAIARFHSVPGCGVQVQADNVVVASGCSGALELVLSTLLDNNDHHPSILLVPQPGFPLYQVIAESHGAIVMHYRLLPDKNWEIDLNHVRELMKQRGSRIRGMVVNNPSNPTGAVYTADHLFAIIRTADECRLPIVADEEYGDLVFGAHRFHPLAVMAARAGHRVPVITCSGLAKQYLLPGWRMGWAVFHDNHFQSLREIQEGAKRLAQVGGSGGASHLVQSAVPALLDQASDDEFTSGEGGGADAMRVWKHDLIQHLEGQANYLQQQLSQAPGLQVMEAQGAMYCMIRFDPQDFSADIQNDVDFCRLLLTEENVLVLPGTCYGVPRVLRVVFCAPKPVLKDATSRMIEFCERHYQYKNKK